MSDNEPKADRDTSLMCLGQSDVIVLFSLYIIALCASISLLILQVSIQDPAITPNEIDMMYILSYSSICGASIFYSRKLYKAGINKEYDFNPDGLSVGRLSTIAYFIIRIPASIIFSIVIYAMWRLSISVSAQSSFEAGGGIKYFLLTMGFFTGFSAGRVVSYFEADAFSLARSGGRLNV